MVGTLFIISHKFILFIYFIFFLKKQSSIEFVYLEEFPDRNKLILYIGYKLNNLHYFFYIQWIPLNIIALVREGIL